MKERGKREIDNLLSRISSVSSHMCSQSAVSFLQNWLHHLGSSSNVVAFLNANALSQTPL